MKKLIKICTIILTSMILSTFILISVSASSANFRYITTCIGENETTININYHTDVSGSKIEYSKTRNFATSKYITPTEETFEYKSSETGYGWPSRIVCKATLSDLEENTNYYYRISYGDEISSIYSFKTGSSSNTEINFLWATDIHAAAGWNHTEETNTELTNILLKCKKEINLVVLTGDQNDRGGMESETKTYWEGIPILRNYVHAAIPGNHEYYLTSGGNYVSPLTFNCYYNNPQNGPECRLNSTYYFKYGNILFIMLDVIDQKNYSETSKWMKQVVQDNPSEWIIVGTHAGFVTCGAYASDAQYMQNYWRRVMEECQVDLVISGHEHIYIRKALWYQGSNNEDLGITYITSLSSGPKQYAKKDGYNDFDIAIANMPFSSNVVSVNKNILTVTLYDENGEKIENGEVTLNKKRTLLDAPLTDQEILNSFTYTYNTDNGYLYSTWNGSVYSQVKNVHFVMTNRLGSETYDMLQYSDYTNTKMFKVNMEENNHITVTFEKRDGTSITTEFDINNYKEKEYTIKYELNGGSFTETPQETFTKGTTYTLPIPIKEGYTFKGWYTSSTFKDSTLKSEISETDSYNMSFYAKWEENVVEPDDEEKEEDTTKSGCEKGLIIINFISIIAVLGVLIKKKD